MLKTVDLLVVGGGSGGIACARRAAAYGASVAVVERAPLGGTCVNVGCVPKKVMWHAGGLAHAMHDAREYGFEPVEAKLHWAELVGRRHRYVRRLNGIYADNLGRDGVHVAQGEAHFVDAHTVEVGAQRIRGQAVVIATGGRPQVPDLPGAELGITSDGFFALERQPESMIVIGGGYIAVELAGLMQALGTRTEMVVRGRRLLRHFDDLLGDMLAECMAADGVKLHWEQRVERIEGEPGDLRVQLACGETLRAEQLLWATGRTPNTDGLGLGATGVACADSGAIEVDAFQATSVDGVYAVGDVSGGPALTPVAIAQGRRLADRLFGDRPGRAIDSDLIPTVIFSHPPIGTLGLSEHAARERHGDAVKVYTGRFRALYYGIMDRKVPSAVKLVTVGPDERVVGVHSIGPGSDELLQGFAVALRMGATKADFDDTIAIHPTAAEELVTLKAPVPGE